jgi:hypothetical protein
MTNQKFEDPMDEFNELDFFQTMGKFSSIFSVLSLGELMALGGKFLELAHGEMNAEADEQISAGAIAQAIEEVIVFRLKDKPDALKKYLDAKRLHLEFLHESALSHKQASTKTEPKSSVSAVFGWFGRKS